MMKKAKAEAKEGYMVQGAWYKVQGKMCREQNLQNVVS